MQVTTSNSVCCLGKPLLHLLHSEGEGELVFILDRLGNLESHPATIHFRLISILLIIHRAEWPISVIMVTYEPMTRDKMYR